MEQQPNIMFLELHTLLFDGTATFKVKPQPDLLAFIPLHVILLLKGRTIYVCS